MDIVTSKDNKSLGDKSEQAMTIVLQMHLFALVVVVGLVWATPNNPNLTDHFALGRALASSKSSRPGCKYTSGHTLRDSSTS